jgi:hypothetical protein
VVKCTGLENRHTLTGIGGSNPSLSAIQLPNGAVVLTSHVETPSKTEIIADRGGSSFRATAE